MRTAQDLQGVWNLVRWEITYDDGRPTTYPFGPDATGLIQYTHDGGMAACIAREDRAPLSSASVRSAPEAERLAAFESFFQYAGRYEVRQHEGRAQDVPFDGETPGFSLRSRSGLELSVAETQVVEGLRLNPSRLLLFFI
jgi:hypothetical protein